MFELVTLLYARLAPKESPRLSSETVDTVIDTLGLMAGNFRPDTLTAGLRSLWDLRFTLVLSYDQSATFGFVAVSRQRFGVFFAFIVCLLTFCADLQQLTELSVGLSATRSVFLLGLPKFYRVAKRYKIRSILYLFNGQFKLC